MVNGLHLYSAILTSGHSKRFTILPNIHPFMHTFTHRRWCPPHKACLLGAVRGRRLAQWHLDTPLGRAGDGTSNPPVTSQPAPPSEPHAAPLGLRCDSLPAVGTDLDESATLLGHLGGAQVGTGLHPASLPERRCLCFQHLRYHEGLCDETSIFVCKSFLPVLGIFKYIYIPIMSIYTSFIWFHQCSQVTAYSWDL